MSLLLRQLFDRPSSTYTYLLADSETREAVLIDPVIDQVDRDTRLLGELELTLVYSLDTHVHADHVTGSGLLRERLGAVTVLSNRAGVGCASKQVADDDRLQFGSYEIEVRLTPGHTAGCTTFVVRDGGRTLAFTGDALFIRGCGRTDFQQGDSATLYDSVHRRIYSLPDDTVVYPGHDYRGHTTSTVAEEKRHNPRLNEKVDCDQFVQIMSELKLSDPKLMDVAVPANLGCGLK